MYLYINVCTNIDTISQKKLADPLVNKLTVKFMDGLQSLAAWRRCMLAD